MLMNTHEEMANFNTYVLVPMSFLCATFFSPDRLPLLLRWVVEILPLTHASQALRLVSASDVVPWGSVLVLMVYSAVLLGIGSWQIQKAEE